MDHELDQDRQRSRGDASPRCTDDSVEPGRLSRSALLRKPEHSVASGLVQRAARDGNGVAEDAEEAVTAAAASSGASLPEPLMRKFEGALGSDLSGVRVHTGEASQKAADAVGAKAYTMGNDIHFGAGHYDPSSATGEHLLAHEVAHTVQQSGGAARMQFKLEVSSPGDSQEQEADRAAEVMTSEPTREGEDNHTSNVARAAERQGKLDSGIISRRETHSKIAQRQPSSSAQTPNGTRVAISAQDRQDIHALIDRVTVTYLTGEGGARLAGDVANFVDGKFAALAARYAQWRSQQGNNALPVELTHTPMVRSFDRQAEITGDAIYGIIRDRISAHPGDASQVDITSCIRDVMRTRSMPGFSRHHWGTEIDVLNPDAQKWANEPPLIRVAEFLGAEANRFNFFHPYSGGRGGHVSAYQNEPWHISYWPISNSLQADWENLVARSAVLPDLIDKTSSAIHQRMQSRGLNIPLDVLTRSLRGMDLPGYQRNVADSP